MKITPQLLRDSLMEKLLKLGPIYKLHDLLVY